MKIKLDENLSKAHAEFLQQAGYDCDRVTDEKLSGADDETVWREVCQEERFFITLDLDFADIRQFPPGTHPGILLLRPNSSSSRAVLGLLKRIVKEYSLFDWQGCFVVANERQVRIRRPKA